MIVTIKKKATKTLLVFALIMGCIFSLMIQPVNAEELKGDEVEGTEYLCNESEGDYGQEIEINEDEYFEIADDVLDEALTDCNEESRIDSLDEIYGDKIDDETIEKVARIYIASETQLDIKDFAKIKEIKIVSKIPLFDANDKNTYVGFNYRVNDDWGYVLIASHTKAPLIKEHKENAFLPNTKVFYFSDGEFYLKDGDGYKTLQGDKLSEKEFKTLKKDRREGYYNFTNDLLSTIELDTVNMLNNVIFLTSGIDTVQDLNCCKKYKGQDGEGYGGISSPEKYL